MADASKLRQLRRAGLGAPPPIEEARTDLTPALSQTDAPSPILEGKAPEHRNHQASRGAFESRIDGRSLRRSGRTVQFATRVSPEFDDRIRQIAKRDGLLLVEVLERALDALEQR
jgi:hypothetical protein